MAGSKAVIWDMDGVIVDTAACHLKAWQAVFKKRGIEFNEEDFRRGFGQRNDAIIAMAAGGKISRREIDVISLQKEAGFRDSTKGKLTPLPGVIKLMTSLKEREFKMALASSAPMENIELVTKTLDIGDCFEAIVCDKDVAEGKPSPKVFLLAAERLGVMPRDCLVIEDAATGVAAAKRAGMHCLAVTNTNPRQSLKEADLVVDSLETVSASDVESFLGAEA